MDIKRQAGDNNLTITAVANDNIGVYYYYFSIENGDYVKTENNTFTFENLTYGEIYNVKLYVEDAAGNISDVFSDDVLVTRSLSQDILANYSKSERNNFNTIYTSSNTKELFSAEDNFGISYYFAGNPTDNWVQFAGYYWRIIRINGDGTIRIIYQGTDATATGDSTQIKTGSFNSGRDNAKVGYMYGTSSNASYEETHANINNSIIKNDLDSWYKTNIADNGYEKFIDGEAGFCGDRTVFDGTGIGVTSTVYGTYNRLYTQKNPTYKCEVNDLYTTENINNIGNQSLVYPVGLISADEIVYAGGVYGVNNTSFYLYNQKDYWIMSPSAVNSYDARIFFVRANGSLDHSPINSSFGIRPVINLRMDVSFIGEGTQNNPYVIQDWN